MAATAYVDAALVPCAEYTRVSTPLCCRTFLIHLAIVSHDTDACGFL